MTAFDPEKITFFAKTDARGQDLAFGIKAKDRQRHMYVVGKTGMGKSTLLENMAAQDIMNGEGMAFIDPHGSAAETLLEYVPEHRVKDVVYFAPFDLEYPVSFNIMEDVGPDKRHLVVSGLMSTFKKIWVDAWSARMEYILTNALLVLIEYPDTTLLSVNRLFSDKAYRKKVVEACQDPAVKSFWVDEFANYTDRFTADALPAIQNKIGQFTGNPLIRNIIGQPHSSFDIRDMMDNKKILIMNLSKGLIGETNANLLGSMLTTRIYLAAMSRADLGVEKMKQMPNFYFYVDEFQSFANATFANILSEARKYHLNLIIAHQYIEQMEEEVRSAVFGNVGTTVSFRVGPFDAEVLETVFAPRFMAVDLVNLGFAQIYLTLMIDGIGSQPFSAKTLPPVKLPEISCREMVIDASRHNYTKSREEVEKIVTDLHTPIKNEEPKKTFDKKPSGSFQPPGQTRNNQTDNFQSRKPFVPRDGDRRQQNSDRRSPIENNNFVPKRNFDNNEVAPKPSVVEKTPDDLRQILSKMTESREAKKEIVVPEKIKEKTLERVPLAEVKNDANKSFTDQPRKMPLQKVFAPTKPSSDLKNALAEALAKVVEPAVENKVENAPTTTVQTDSRSVTENKTPIVSRDEVKTDLTSVQNPDLEVLDNEAKSMKPIHNSLIKPDKDKIKFAPRFRPTPTETKSLIRKVVIQNRQQHPVAVDSPKLNPPAVGFGVGSRRSVVNDWSASNIDANVIKKMLKHDSDERSPFQ